MTTTTGAQHAVPEKRPVHYPSSIDAVNTDTERRGRAWALASVVSPWLAPFEPWDALLATTEGWLGKSGATDATMVFVNHLLQQPLSTLLSEGAEVIRALPLMLGGDADALRRALSYPFAEEPNLRVDILVLLAQAHADNHQPTRGEESELLWACESVLSMKHGFTLQKGIAADLAGLMFKNSRYLPRSAARGEAQRFMELALTFLDRDAHPQDWATVHNNLGNLLARGVTRDLVRDLDGAIEHYGAAFSVKSPDDPPKFGMTCDNLATAYARRASLTQSLDDLQLAFQWSQRALACWNFTEHSTTRLKGIANNLAMAGIARDLLRTPADGEALSAANADCEFLLREVCAHYRSRATEPFFHISIHELELLHGMLASVESYADADRRWAQSKDELVRVVATIAETVEPGEQQR